MIRKNDFSPKAPLAKWAITLLVIPLISGFAKAQNIAPNPSFETYSPCPTTYGNGGSLECTPWQNGNQATADYYNACATGTDVWVPDNIQGSQTAHTGNAYTGIYMRESSIWREYIQAPLLEPCVAGYSYEVSFYVSLADLYCPTANFGAYLSVNPPPGNNIGTPGVIPQVESNLGFITENNDWVLVSGCFTAQGGEQWITIGNFYNNANTPMQPGCTTSYASYYYIDDVSVVQGDETNNLELELGDPVTTCEPYEIDPGVPDVEYHWSDGSTDPTLVVTESGTYSLTITAGCGNVGIDSIEVDFIGSPAVNIGPETLALCEGESYGIHLLDEAGDYIWEDGSTSPNRIINTSGTYSVTMDDGCDITTDEITITVTGMPDPFSLGDDAFICDGDEIVYSFDPDLGTFLWQDGSITPNYTIWTSGLYSLTISNNCGSVSDEILVSDGATPQIDLGPQVIQFCEGENINLDFNFDPALGEFIWQDGNTSPTYLITAPGVYSVTVTNGCGSGSDQITVEVNDLPEPFTLGEDANICTGDEIHFSFDPSLGIFEWQDQSSSSDYTINSGGIYSLTISNNCGEETDSIIVTELTAPEIELGNANTTICDGQVLEYDFPPSMGDFIWQDGSTTSSYPITEPGTYAVTVSNVCGTDNDVIEVELVTQPAFNLPENMIICPAQLPVMLDVSNTPDATAFLWQDGSTQPFFEVNAAGTYAVTVSNACFSATDQVVIQVEDASPFVQLPADVVLCPGETLTLDGQGLPGQYEWQDGSVLSTFLISAAGTYSLTITNQCGSGTDSITVSYIDPLPVPDLGPDVSLCPGEIYVFHTNISGVDYTWQDMSTADSLMVTTPGTYILQISNQCGTASDSAIVTIDGNPPVVDLPSSVQLCNQEVISVDAGISGVQYLWSDGSTGSSIQVSGPGMYSITVTNACGNDMDTVEIIDGGSSPIVDLGDDLTFCEGDVVLIAPTAIGAASWLWHDGSTAADLMINSPGLVVVQVTNQCGMDTDSMLISMLPATPVLDLGMDTILCPGEMLTYSINFPGVEIEWSDGSTGNNFNVTSAGPVFATISNQCGSTADTVNVEFLPASPVLDLGLDQSLCPGEVITIAPGISDVDYLWHDGSMGNSFTTTEAGTIALIVSNACGADTDTLTITENSQGPQVDLGDDINACEGESVTLSAGTLGVDYLWQDGSTDAEFTVTVSGTYILQVSNACGMDSDTVVVSITGTIPFPSLGPDTTLCEGSILNLYSLADAGTSILWQDGSSMHEYIVTSAGSFVLTETNLCGSAADTVVVSYQGAPLAFSLGPDTVLCPDEFMVLFVPASQDMVTWQDGSHDISMVADHTQAYWVEVSNQCGTARDEMMVVIDDRTPVVSAEPRTLACGDDNIQLDVTQPFDASYLWNTGSTDPFIEINAAGLYTITITTQCQSAEHIIEVTGDKDCAEDIYIPNVFSPNGDGVNDYFEMLINPDLQAVSASCSIFDRWGNHVFESRESNFKWDGDWKGAAMPSSVYAYMILVDYYSGGRVKQKRITGDVTIVR